MTYALWIVQGLLALVFLFAGGMKLVLPLARHPAPVGQPAGRRTSPAGDRARRRPDPRSRPRPPHRSASTPHA